MVIQSNGTSQTIRLGKKIGSRLRAGDVVALKGELGAGKTQFIKGLASGAGVGKSTYVSSPSFTLINEYPGKVPFYHIDLFRLDIQREAEGLGLEDYFHGEGITAIEWADKIPNLLPKELLRIELLYVGEHTRSFRFLGRGERPEELVKKISDWGLPMAE